MTVEHGQFDILQRRGAGQEIETLKHKPQLFITKDRQLFAVECGDLDAVEQIVSARGLVEAAERCSSALIFPNRSHP